MTALFISNPCALSPSFLSSFFFFLFDCICQYLQYNATPLTMADRTLSHYNLREKLFNIASVSLNFPLRFSRILILKLRRFSSIYSLWRDVCVCVRFNHEPMLSFIKRFYNLAQCSYGFFLLFSFNGVKYISWILNGKLSLHSCNIAHLVVMHSLFNILVDWTC